MKSLTLLIVLSLFTIGLWAQDAAQKPASPPPPMHHAGMMGMHQHMMQTQDQVTKMRASLEKMKANLSKITDPALKAHAQLDADLWEQMVQHMEGMSKMMSGHGNCAERRYKPHENDIAEIQ